MRCARGLLGLTYEAEIPVKSLKEETFMLGSVISPQMTLDNAPQKLEASPASRQQTYHNRITFVL